MAKRPRVIGGQLFYAEVECYKHVAPIIEKIEFEGMAVIDVMPLVDYDVVDGVTSMRAVILRVAGEARPLKEPKTNVVKRLKNTA